MCVRVCVAVRLIKSKITDFIVNLKRDIKNDNYNFIIIKRSNLIRIFINFSVFKVLARESDVIACMCLSMWSQRGRME